MSTDNCITGGCFASLMPPTGESCRLPVLRVLVVRIPGALVFQAGVMVTGGGGGVTAVLVDLIQTPDKNGRRLALMAVLSVMLTSVYEFVMCIWKRRLKKRKK